MYVNIYFTNLYVCDWKSLNWEKEDKSKIQNKKSKKESKGRKNLEEMMLIELIPGI